MAIGEKLEKLLALRNTNVNKLSTNTGINPQTLYGIVKRDNTKVDINTLQIIADELCVPLDYFSDSSSNYAKMFLTNAEKDLLEKFSELDDMGVKAVNAILDIEVERVLLQKSLSAKKTDKGTPIHKPEAYRTSRKYPANVVVLEDYSDAPEDTTTIPVYDAGASAGTGIFLDSDYYDVIAIADNYTNRKANFAVWVDGHSMEPKFNDGDLVLVRQQPQVDIGEIGIFIVNGEGFIKKLGEGELISLNPDYENIPLNEWDDICCKGRVLGKL